jgi:NAD(P)-dependent dehydrogenase (short-subunit alcohol dehydrogenase family)
MDRLEGRVAVVTGGAAGIGRAMAERFCAEGMRVAIADVEEPVLEATVAELRDQGFTVIGQPTDVSDADSVIALRDRVLEEFGTVHLLCNNAGIGAGAEGPMWEHEANDWRWALGVNLWGVIHGVNAFVPHMVASGQPGHVVNTSSGNGGISPLAGTPQYAVTKAAVVTFTECLYAQLQASGAPVGASVLFPGPHMLRTGLFSAWRNRPQSLAKVKPRQTPYPTVEDVESQMAKAGIEVHYTEPAEVADQVVAGVKAGNFWILSASDRTDAQIRARADSLLARSNPAYLRAVPG